MFKSTKGKKRFLAILLLMAVIVSNFAFAAETGEEFPAVDIEAVTRAERELGIYGEDLTWGTLQTVTLAKEDIPEAVGEGLVEENGHVNRMRTQESDMNTVIFQNRDGTKTMYYFGEPVKYVNAAGDVKDKSTAIYAREKGFETRDNDVILSFAENSVDGVTLAYGETVITMKAAGVASFAAAEKESLYSASDGDSRDRVVYAGVFGAGTALVYTPTFSGLKEDIVLSRYTGRNEFAFTLETNGLVLKEDNGRFYLYDKDGSQAAELADIVCFDSEGKTEFGSIKVETVTEGAEYVVTVCVDEGYLRSAAYPVYVDPTIWVRASDSSAYIEDATIYSGYPTSNFGSWYFPVAGYYDASYGVGRTLVKLPGLTSNGTYVTLSAMQVISANFRYYESGGTSAKTINAYAFTGSSWSESTVTWNNASASSYSTLIDDASVGPAAYANFDITSLVKGWINGTYTAAKGFILVNPDEANSSNKKAFVSAEYTQHLPYVAVKYASVWTSVSDTFRPDIGQTILPVTDDNGEYTESYFVYLYTGITHYFTFQSCLAKTASGSYYTAIAVYDSTGNEIDSTDLTAGTASLSSIYIPNTGTYRVEVKAQNSSLCFLRVKVASGGTLEPTSYFAQTCRNYKFLEASDTTPYACADYAISSLGNYYVYPYTMWPIDQDEDQVAYILGTVNYHEVASTSNGVAVYFLEDLSTHFVKITDGNVTAKLYVGGPIVSHDSVNVYYDDSTNSYGTTIIYYEPN